MSPTLPSNIVKCTASFNLAHLLNIGLFGVISNQVYYYYLAFPIDRLYSKFTVYGVYILASVETIFVIHDAFERFGLGFGDLVAFDDMHMLALSIPLISAIVGCVVQSFYAYRISVFSRSRLIGYLIVTISLVGLSGGMVTAAKAFQIGKLSQLTGTTLSLSLGLWWGCCALCDIIIAVSMTYFLSKHDSSFKSTHLMLTRLTRLTIETGTLTALVAVISLFLHFGYLDACYFAVPLLINTKLYCSTLLVLLNCRLRIVGGREEILDWSSVVGVATETPTMHLAAVHLHDSDSFQKGNLSNGTTSTKVEPSKSGVHIATDVYIE